MALTLILFFSYTFHIFPISVGGRAIGLQPSWNWQFIKSTISNSILPALSIIIVSYGWWFLSMKALSLNIAKEDYVLFAEIKGLSRKEIMKRYILRNALLPQITQLAMSLGTMFSGALLTEVIFSYPGLGTLMFMAVTNADYNLMIGITSLSIIAVALAGLLLDFIYPLLDPRIRYH
jgi:peptide/nickel transport system permease protein